MLYIDQNLADDVETQKKGLAIILFPTASFDMTTITEPEARRDLRAMMLSSAIRPSAIHVCLPDTPFLRLVGALHKALWPSNVGVRVQIHTGTCTYTIVLWATGLVWLVNHPGKMHLRCVSVLMSLNNTDMYILLVYFTSLGSVTECQYKLLGYGIPGDQLPIKSSEIAKTQNHLKWITYCTFKDNDVLMGPRGGPNQQQGQQQQQPPSPREPFSAIYCPQPSDVLAGRGPLINHHPGNITYRTILESKLDRYDQAKTTDQKFHVTLEVVMEIGALGGRFLTRHPNNDWWVPIVDQEVARLKVSVAFRDLRKINKAKENRKKTKNGGSSSLSVPMAKNGICNMGMR